MEQTGGNIITELDTRTGSGQAAALLTSGTFPAAPFVVGSPGISGGADYDDVRVYGASYPTGLTQQQITDPYNAGPQ